MECGNFRPLLDPMCDGVLDAKDVAMVLNHLRSCTKCHNEWMELEQLRARFQSTKNKPTLPPGLMMKISADLKAEEKKIWKQLLQRSLPSFSFAALAATVVIIGLFAVPLVNTSLKLAMQYVSAQALVKDLTINSMKPAQSRSELVNEIGYDVKQLNMPDWQMAKYGLTRSQAHMSVARFDFVNKLTGDRLTCYQGRKGTIHAMGAGVDFAGKKVIFGTQGLYNFALWSQNDRDYLFVTESSQTKLKEMISNISNA